MGTAGYLGPDQCGFRVKSVGIYIFQGISSQIIVSVSAGCIETRLTDFVFLHSQNHFHLVVFCIFVDGGKTLLQFFFYFISICQYLTADPKLAVHCIHFLHHKIPLSLHIFSMYFKMASSS